MTDLSNMYLIVLFCSPWFVVAAVTVKVLIKGETIGV